MSTLQRLEAFSDSGLEGQQTNQRDWSPFVAHFASYQAMTDLREALEESVSTEEIHKLFVGADRSSYNTFKKIMEDKTIKSSRPAKKSGIDPCVCLSECTLTGILSHCEKYGRFGFVFGKGDIYSAGGRPCLYVDRECRDALKEMAKGKPDDSPERKVMSLSNIYSPPGTGSKIQDYTHEREWRIFDDIDLSEVTPKIYIYPSAYEESVGNIVEEESKMTAIDTLMKWGV